MILKQSIHFQTLDELLDNHRELANIFYGAGTLVCIETYFNPLRMFITRYSDQNEYYIEKRNLSLN